MCVKDRPMTPMGKQNHNPLPQDDMTAAPCRGKSWLFDRTDLASHVEARKICESCPVIEACAKLLAVEKANPLAKHGGPSGTWAGQLVLGKGSRKVGGRTKPREHGTERGYQQHRHVGDDMCEPCRLAHNAHTAEKARARLQEAS